MQSEDYRPVAEPLSGRLHPAALGVWASGQAVPLALLLLAGTVSWEFAGGIGTFGLVAGLVRWSRFHWQVDAGTLTITQGLVSRQRRVIPLDRIQAVESVRKLRHRIFGVVELRVETVGGSSTEGRLDALSPAIASQLRTALLGRDTSAAAGSTDEDEDTVLVRLTPRELVVAGLTGGRIGVAAALVGAAEQILGDRLGRMLTRLPTMLTPETIAGAAVTFLLAVFVISVAATALVYWDFTLARDGDNLLIRRGLLEQRRDTVPLRRVQAVRVEENLVRRMFGLAALKVVVAGRSDGQSGRETGVLLPIGKRARAFRLAAEVLEHSPVGELELAPMPRRARDRRLVRAGVVTLVLTAGCVIAFGSLGWFAALAAVPAFALAVAAYRALGHGSDAHILAARAGVLVRRTWLVPERALQSTAVVSNPFQRWRDLATVELHIPRSAGSADPALIDLDAGEAANMLPDLAMAAARHGD